MVTLSEVETVKNAIYNIETELIQQKKFRDDLTGQPKFVTNLDIQNKTGLDESQVVSAINSLDTQEFMRFDNNLLTSQDPKIKHNSHYKFSKAGDCGATRSERKTNMQWRTDTLQLPK